MIALIIKDIASLKKTLILSFLLCLGLSVYAVHSDALIIIPLICAFMPLILNSIAFGYEVQSGFEQFAFSLPIKKSSYVFSKLFFAFVFSLFTESYNPHHYLSLEYSHHPNWLLGFWVVSTSWLL